MQSLMAAGVVWDFDGTLFNSYLIQKELLSEIFRRRSMKVPSDKEFLRHYHGHLRDSIRGLSHLDGQELEDLYEEFIYSEERHYDNPTHLYFPDALDLLERTHKASVRQIIISNRPHFSDTRLGSPRNLADRAPLAGRIEAVVCGDDNDFHKPDVRVLDAVEEKLGPKRGDLVVIGDQFVDIEFAQELGCQAVLIMRESDDLPHLDKLKDGWREQVHVVHSLKEVAISLPIAESVT